MKTLTRPNFILSGFTTKADARRSLLPWTRTPKTQAYTVWITTSRNRNIDSITFLEARGVKMTDPQAIKDFLIQHNEIKKCLFDLPDKTADYFGESGLGLEVFTDPEGIEEVRELFVTVTTRLSPQEANERLVKIYKEWFIPQGECLEKVNISLSFY